MSLVKKQANQLDIQKQELVIQSILSGEVSTAEELAELHNLSLLESVKLLSNPEFNQTLQFYSKANSNLYFHTKGIKKVIDIAINSEDNKEVMTAMKFIAQYTGNTKGESSDLNVNVNLGSLIDKAEHEKKVSSIDITEFEKL